MTHTCHSFSVKIYHCSVEIQFLVQTRLSPPRPANNHRHYARGSPSIRFSKMVNCKNCREICPENYNLWREDKKNCQSSTSSYYLPFNHSVNILMSKIFKRICAWESCFDTLKFQNDGDTLKFPDSTVVLNDYYFNH